MTIQNSAEVELIQTMARLLDENGQPRGQYKRLRNMMYITVDLLVPHWFHTLTVLEQGMGRLEQDDLVRLSSLTMQQFASLIIALDTNNIDYPNARHAIVKWLEETGV